MTGKLFSCPAQRNDGIHLKVCNLTVTPLHCYIKRMEENFKLVFRKHIISYLELCILVFVFAYKYYGVTPITLLTELFTPYMYFTCLEAMRKVI